MKKLRFTLPPVLASRLVLFLVGFYSCALPGRSDTVQLDPPLDHYLVTNITFVSRDEYVSYTNDVISYIDDTELYLDWVVASNAVLSSQASLLASQVNAAYYSNTDPSLDNVLSAARQTAYDLSRGVSKVRQESEFAQYELSALRSAVTSGVYYDSLDITLTAPTGTVGGCSCPDYTAVLNSINSHLSDISGWEGYLQNIWDFFAGDLDGSGLNAGNAFFSFVYSLNLGYGDPLENVGYLGSWSFFDLSNRVAIAKEWERIAARYDPFSIATSSDPLVNALSPAFQGIRQLFADDFDEHYLRNEFVDDFRAFYANPPTNTTVFVTNSVDSPLYVSLTNHVQLSVETLSAITSSFHSALHVGDLYFSVTNWNVLADILQNVVICVSNDVSVQVSQEVDIAQDMIDMQAGSDPEADTIGVQYFSYSPLSALGSHVSSLVRNYGEMFSSVPDDPPNRIFLHPGWTLGGIEVPSLWWEIDTSSNSPLGRFLGVVRGVFSAVWIVGFLTCIYVFIAVDLFIVGCCAYMVYGLLLGRSQAAVDGIFYCFKVLAKLLGFSVSK